MREYRSTPFLRFIYRKVITSHASLALKVYKCKVLERFRNIEKAPSRDHFQDGAFLLWIRTNTSRRSRRWRNRCSSNTCLASYDNFDTVSKGFTGFHFSAEWFHFSLREILTAPGVTGCAICHRVPRGFWHDTACREQSDSPARVYRLQTAAWCGEFPPFWHIGLPSDTVRTADGQRRSCRGCVSMPDRTGAWFPWRGHISHIAEPPAWRVPRKICRLSAWGSRDRSRGALVFLASVHLHPGMRKAPRDCSHEALCISLSIILATKTICRCWLICSDLMQRKGTTCIQKLKEQMTCNYGSTRAPLMKRMLCREMIFAL